MMQEDKNLLNQSSSMMQEGKNLFTHLSAFNMQLLQQKKWNIYMYIFKEWTT